MATGAVVLVVEQAPFRERLLVRLLDTRRRRRRVLGRRTGPALGYLVPFGQIAGRADGARLTLAAERQNGEGGKSKPHAPPFCVAGGFSGT